MIILCDLEKEMIMCFKCLIFNIKLRREIFSLFPDNKVDIYAWIDSEISDFLDNAWWAVDIDDSLVDSHLESVPGLWTLTTGTLTGGDLENLSWDANWSLCFVALVLGSSNDLSACSLKWLNFLASKGHSNNRLWDANTWELTWFFGFPLEFLLPWSCPSQRLPFLYGGSIFSN